MQESEVITTVTLFDIFGKYFEHLFHIVLIQFFIHQENQILSF